MAHQIHAARRLPTWKNGQRRRVHFGRLKRPFESLALSAALDGQPDRPADRPLLHPPEDIARVLHR